MSRLQKLSNLESVITKNTAASGSGAGTFHNIHMESRQQRPPAPRPQEMHPAAVSQESFSNSVSVNRYANVSQTPAVPSAPRHTQQQQPIRPAPEETQANQTIEKENIHQYPILPPPDIQKQLPDYQDFVKRSHWSPLDEYLVSAAASTLSTKIKNSENRSKRKKGTIAAQEDPSSSSQDEAIPLRKKHSNRATSSRMYPASSSRAMHEVLKEIHRLGNSLLADQYLSLMINNNAATSTGGSMGTSEVKKRRRGEGIFI